ncbi:MutT family NTP pyrophosphatase (plasmid) [Agrobacterium tumefaciens F2]|nr:MutT family NTP pyrophosphatase [Agrobacterium tumefaciens F2]
MPFETAISLVPFAGQRHVLRHIQAEFAEKQPLRHLLIAKLPSVQPEI